MDSGVFLFLIIILAYLIQNKFIETPRGTFEMKYFFDKGSYGEEQDMQISSKTIENRIKELIKNETPSNILSDDKIVNLLKKYDIHKNYNV